MDLNDDFFASEIPVKRTLTLTLTDGRIVSQDVFVRELPALEMRKLVMLESSPDEKRVAGALAALISRAICDEDANPVMSEEKAGKLKPTVAGQLRDLIMEVNGFGGKL